MRRVAVVLCVLLVACSHNADKRPQSLPTPTSGHGPTTTTPFATSAISTPRSAQSQLTNVTAGDHDGFTRVVFTFADAVPGYSLKPASPPFVQDGSGARVAVRGSAFLALRLLARAHDDAGKSAAPVAIAGVSSTLLEVRRTGDFEGVVNYVLGLNGAKAFRTFTLAFPSRLVVDIAD